MKRIFCALLVICFAACKKEHKDTQFNRNYFETVKMALKDSLSEKDFTALDFNRALLSKSEHLQLFFLRVPLKNKSFSEEFVMVKTNAYGRIEAGRMVHLERQDAANNAHLDFNGFISIHSLTGQPVLQSPIQKGYITALHPAPTSRMNSVVPILPANVMPEVFIVAYAKNYGGIEYSSWLWLDALFYNSVDDANSYYGDGGQYGSLEGDQGTYSGAGGSYGSGYGSGSGVAEEGLMEMEEENIYNAPKINVWKYFNCFDQMPSAGAIYTIKLCVDVPSNGNPGASSRSSGSSAGHTFLTISKSNGNSKVTQSFGFYPEREPSFFDPFTSVESAMRDNGEDEYNASLEMTITEAQYKLIWNKAISTSTLPYNLKSYNCTSYALDVINYVRQTPIKIDPYVVVLPSDPAPYGVPEPITFTFEESPQMLFFKLLEMKNSNTQEAGRIEIDQTHNSKSPASHGECKY